jgi:hypothetical protein
MKTIEWLTIASLTLTACSDPQTAVYEENPELKAVIDQTESVSVFQVQTGDCLIGGLQDVQVSDMDKIDCSKPHIYEVYFTFQLPVGPFPGDAAIEEQADNRCQAEFESFVGKSFEDSSLTFSRLTPNAEGWRLQKDREIVCMIQTMDDSTLSQSAKGSAL